MQPTAEELTLEMSKEAPFPPRCFGKKTRGAWEFWDLGFMRKISGSSVGLQLAELFGSSTWVTLQRLQEAGEWCWFSHPGMIPSGEHTKSEWKWPCSSLIYPLKMVIFQSDVSLPGGNSQFIQSITYCNLLKGVEPTKLKRSGWLAPFPIISHPFAAEEDMSCSLHLFSEVTRACLAIHTPGQVSNLVLLCRVRKVLDSSHPNSLLIIQTFPTKLGFQCQNCPWIDGNARSRVSICVFWALFGSLLRGDGA